MRRIYTIMTMAVLLTAGGHCAFGAKTQNIAIDTLRYEKSDSTAEVSLLVHWPAKGNKTLVDSLQKHINYLLSSEIKSPKDIQAYGESLFESLSEDWHSAYDEMEPEDRLGAFSKTHSIINLAETDRYITYYYSTFDYGGGMHGYTTDVGFTFRKSDGKQITLLGEMVSRLLCLVIHLHQNLPNLSRKA